MNNGIFYFLIVFSLILSFKNNFAKITINAPDTLFINTEYTLTSFFDDTLNSEIKTEYWHWRIEVIDGGGNTFIKGIDSLYGQNESNWHTSIDTIPVEHAGQIYIDQQYREFYAALILVYTTDNTKIIHTFGKYIFIVGSKCKPHNEYMEDFIFIDYCDRLIYENSKREFKGIFVDDDYNGSYADYFNWKLFLFTTEGIFMLDKADSLYAHREHNYNVCIWSINIDTLPSSYSYITDSAGSIITMLAINTNNNYNQYLQSFMKLSFIKNPVSIKRSKYDNNLKYFELYQNYPNPFNPSTTISFSLNRSSVVELIIFNSLGQQVKKIVQKQFSSGNHSLLWDGKDNNRNNMPTGVYIYQIKTGYSMEARKMLLIR